MGVVLCLVESEILTLAFGSVEITKRVVMHSVSGTQGYEIRHFAYDSAEIMKKALV